MGDITNVATSFCNRVCASLAALAVTANGSETDETAQSSGKAINPDALTDLIGRGSKTKP